VGASVGRVTAKTLLPLFSDVVLLEPVEYLLHAAASQGTASQEHSRNDALRETEMEGQSGSF